MAFLIQLILVVLVQSLAAGRDLVRLGDGSTNALLLGANNGFISTNPSYLARLLLRQQTCENAGYYPCTGTLKHLFPV